MTPATNTFMGRELPPLRDGNVWLMQIYPGGRKVLVQKPSSYALSVDDAVAALKAGRHVYVQPDDTVAVVYQSRISRLSA